MFVFGLGDRTPYDHNVGILKKYSETNYRLTVMKAIRMAGYEERNPSPSRPNVEKPETLQSYPKVSVAPREWCGSLPCATLGNTS